MDPRGPFDLEPPGRDQRVGVLRYADLRPVDLEAGPEPAHHVGDGPSPRPQRPPTPRQGTRGGIAVVVGSRKSDVDRPATGASDASPAAGAVSSCEGGFGVRLTQANR